MTTMSTQPGSSAPILKVPAAITPDFAAIPEELGNVFLSATAWHEPSSTGWYVRWNGIGAYIGTTDRRKQSALMGMVIIVAWGRVRHVQIDNSIRYSHWVIYAALSALYSEDSQTATTSFTCQSRSVTPGGVGYFGMTIGSTAMR